MILGIFPSLGGSIASQRKDGREGLFLDYYLPAYLRTFNEVHYFSYAREEQSMIKQVFFHCNLIRLHRYVYAMLLPLIRSRSVRKCSVFRVMHFNGILPAIIAKYLWKTPFVVTYGYDYARFAEIENHHIKAKVIRFLTPWFLNQSDYIIVTTEELRQAVLRLTRKPGHVVLVPNGVDTQTFQPLPSAEIQNGTERPFTLLFVGRLERQKNLPFLLEVISELRRSINIKLEIVGSGSQESMLKRIVSEDQLPVEFLGNVPYVTIYERYQKADCFVSTSLVEGHPKTLIEAMSCGLPCVVSDCPGHVGLIKHDKNGLLLPLDKIERWARTLENLISDKPKQASLRRNARERIVNFYDIHKTLSKELDLLTATSKHSGTRVELEAS